MDLRARLIPELCDASASLFTEVKSLQGMLSILSTALKGRTGKPPPEATEHTPGVEQEDAPHTESSTMKNASSISPPCNQATGATVSPIVPHDPTHRFDSSWYCNAQNHRRDDTAGPTLRSADNVTREYGTRCSEHLNIDTLADAPDPPFMGG
jgi:hypothetical protein